MTTAKPARVEEFARDWEALFERGDHAAMAAYYADDAELIATQLETIAGRPAIARFWDEACRGARAVGLRRSVHVEAVERDRELAALRGSVELRRDATTTTVRYVT